MTNPGSSWQERWQRALREQHALIFDPDTKALKPQFSETVKCPVCGSDRSKLEFEKDWFRYVRCQKCSMIYMNPRMNLAATYAFYNSDVNAIYNEIKFDQDISTTQDDQINLANLDLIDHHRQKTGGVLLEIGSAKGFFLSKAQDRGYKVYGLELNKKNAEFSRRLVGETIISKELFDIHFADEMFDVIYMRDVIEHIPNPKQFLQELNRIAKPGSLIFIETHNMDSIINQAVREKHMVIFGFEHPSHWSVQTLGLALSNSGYDVQKVVHASLDCTLRDILSYYCEPSFTTILPAKENKIQQLLFKALRFPFRIWPISRLDRKIGPQIANSLKKGSVMKVLAKKR